MNKKLNELIAELEERKNKYIEEKNIDTETTSVSIGISIDEVIAKLKAIIEADYE